MSTSYPLIEVRPSWWNYFWYLLFFWLVIPLVIAIWKRYSIVLRVYHNRIEIERGILAKDIRELYIADVRAVKVTENFTQRLFGLGDVLIETEGSSDDDDAVHGLPDPMEIERLVHEQKQTLKEE